MSGGHDLFFNTDTDVMQNKFDGCQIASSLPVAWASQLIGHAAGANIKVLRMDSAEYPDEVHDFDEALLVLEGQMQLRFGARIIPVRAGEIYLVPSGMPHAVAAGSHGTLLIIDSPQA